MKTKKNYRVTEVELTKHNNGSDYLEWTYGGRRYSAQGEFHIDKRGVLHHEFTTPTGKTKEVKIKYFKD